MRLHKTQCISQALRKILVEGLVGTQDVSGRAVLLILDRVLGIDIFICIAHLQPIRSTFATCFQRVYHKPDLLSTRTQPSPLDPSTNLAIMTTFIFFTLHDVIDIHININILAIAFWSSVLALVLSTSTSQAKAAQNTNQGFDWPYLRYLVWIETLALCLLLVVVKYLLSRVRAGMCTEQKFSF